ncbi:hypothetical protein SRB5_00450 [Streptomyces sp. RB5]|uniref:Uncharacterized protein n=1 Tax=Streptomyces smaragdinus TaxID=2585196 RepID=A0A7K0C910_9ACTN|nr:hypothetical protein [Streptomyces smaragdinus]
MILPDTTPAPSAPALPEPDTLVLLNRPLRPGTDPSTLSVFADQRWRLSPAVFEGHTTAFSIDFSPIAGPFLHTVKTLTWLLLNHTSAGVSTFYFRPRTLAITTITSMFRSLRLFTDWLHGRGRACFGEVSLADLDDYAAHVKATETSHGQREDRLSIVNRCRRTTFSPQLRTIERPQLLGHVGVSLDGLESVLQPIAGSVDRDDVAVVQEAVEDGGGQDFVAEHLSPFAEGLV